MIAAPADLAAYLAAARARAWAWGRHDCTIWVADWCLLRWGIDPAQGLRGAYATEAEARALTAPGLVATVAPRMQGLAVTHAPRPGDVGVILVRGDEVSAIRAAGQRWAFVTPGGLALARCDHVMAWGRD